MNGLEHAAYANDAREAYALYSSMATHELRRLQTAFEADAFTATTPESIAFCAGRLALIATVLKTRSTGNVSDRSVSQT